MCFPYASSTCFGVNRSSLLDPQPKEVPHELGFPSSKMGLAILRGKEGQRDPSRQCPFAPRSIIP